MKAKSIIKFLFISLIFLNCSRNNKINNYGNTGSSPDILFNQQWYLKNTGQMTYFNLRVKNGIDLNISYPQIYTGQGVKAIVADKGVYFDHPNLAPNLLANFSLDFSDSSLGKIPVNKPEIKDKINDTHGTFVAGILGGSHSQKNGFRGVAPNVNIASANRLSQVIDHNQISYSDMDLKLYSHVENNKIQIINESYGTAAYSYTFSHNNSDFIEMSEMNFITVKASGNQTCSTDLANKFYNKNKSSIDAKFLNFNFHNNESVKYLPHNVKNYYKSIRPHISTMEKTASNPYRILVAGISHQGVINNTSTFGSNIWISGFSGGSSSTTLSKDSLNIDPNYVGILTTTIPINRAYGGTYFNKRLLPENREGYYNTELSGTSFATPMISGVIALLLEANPNLSYWDVKYILAKTANRNKLVSDPLPSCIKILSIIGDFSSDFLDLWKTGWVENKAGNFFHNYYGFGLVDTDRAIEMALNIKNGVTPSPYQGKKVQRIQNSLEIQNNSNQIILPNSSITSELVITENINIDGVRVTPYILAAKADSISIQLVSPDETTSQQRGTHSTILYPGNSMIQLSEDESVIEDMPYPVDDYKKDLNDNSGAYLTNAFFEERSKGKWKIIITNHSLDKTFYLEGWKLEIYGH